MNIFKISRFLEIGNKSLFDIPVQEQLAYFDKLGEARNDIDRSYKQFLCQNYFVPLWKQIIWFFVCIFAIPVAIIVFWIKGKRIHFVKQIDTIAEDKGMDEIIPEELTSKYILNHEAWNTKAGLSSDDVRYIISKIFGWRQPYFILKMILLLAKYSPKVTQFHPKQLIEHSEYSFGSSAITDYLHTRGVLHINVQHGEKLLYIRDSFFHYDECYVWDNHYVNLLTRLKAEPTQFRIAVPPSLKIDTESHINLSYYADYKYYLAADNENEIRSIVDSMSFVTREGKSVKYRIHPRYTDINVLRKYVSEDSIELPSKVSILDSISNANCIVGSFTTVLIQAYMSGKQIIIDDATYAPRYNQLKDYGYILAKDEIQRLSAKQ